MSEEYKGLGSLGVSDNDNSFFYTNRIKFCYTTFMKKPLLLFIIGALLLLGAVIAYNRYCQSKPGGCKKTTLNEEDIGPQKGIDW